MAALSAGVIGIVVPNADAATEPVPPSESSPRAEGLPAPARDQRNPLDDPGLRADVAEQLTDVRSGDDPIVVDVEVLHDGADDAVAARVAELGGTVTGQAPGTVVQARMPLTGLRALALSSGVTYVREPVNLSVHPLSAGLPMAGGLTSSVVGIMQAAPWHAAGITGAGVRVGIIDFFNGTKWTTQQGAGEVPAPSATFCQDAGAACSVWDPAEGGHGNAVAETIYDLAPGVSFYLATPGTISDYYAAIDWFAANGVRIVNRSLGSPYDGPGDGTGALDALADYATVRGMTFFNSAGNEGTAQYWRGPWIDSNGNGYLEFAPGDETLAITGPCVSSLGVRWDDWGPPSTRTNYDAQILLGGTKVWPPGQGGNQQAGAPPIELDGISNRDEFGNCSGDYSISIQKLANGAETNDVIEVLMYEGDLEHWQSPGSAGGPIVDSRNPAVVAVGAIDPAAGGSIAPYSSQGPTNDGRVKPDVVAPSCFSNTIYGSCFNGTSAASPVAAAIGALVSGGNLATEPASVAALVKHLAVDRGAIGPDSVYGSGELRLPSPPTGTVSTEPSAFTAIVPARLYDSRGARGAPHPVHDIVDLQVAGWNGLPADVTAVALNVTLTEATGPGYVQVLPTLRPAFGRSANLNIEAAAQTLPNFVITPIGQNGQVSVYAPAGGHVVVDVLGYFRASGAVAAGRFEPLVPHRVLDTRESVATNPSVLPLGWSDHKPDIGELVTLDFKAESGLPSTGVSAVVLSLVGTEPSLPGFVTAYPTGVGLPIAANLNLTPGSTNANTVIVALGPDRRINLFVQAGTHLVADLAGYITDGSAAVSTTGRFVPLGPDRLMDTRIAPDTAFPGVTPRTIAVGGRLGVPADAVAASFNFASTRSTWAGYLQVWPAGSSPSSLFANLNWSRPGQTISSGGIVKLGAGGAVNAQVLTATDIIFDVNGYFTA
ncbi:MAG: S8 family serine peptidase [Acidimicrobiia bacterium]